MALGNDVLNAVVGGAREYQRRYPFVTSGVLLAIMQTDMFNALEQEARSRLPSGVSRPPPSEPPLAVQTTAGEVKCYPLDLLAPDQGVMIVGSHQPKGRFERPNICMPLVPAASASPTGRIRGLEYQEVIVDDPMPDEAEREREPEPNQQLSFEDRIRKLRGRKPKANTFAEYVEGMDVHVSEGQMSWLETMSKEDLERKRRAFEKVTTFRSRYMTNKDSEE